MEANHVHNVPGTVCTLFPTEDQEFAYTMGKKDTPVKLDTRLMYFDLLKLRQKDWRNRIRQHIISHHLLYSDEAGSNQKYSFYLHNST